MDVEGLDDRCDNADLCEICKAINIESLSQESGYKHVENIEALVASTAACMLCGVIAEKLIDYYDWCYQEWRIDRGCIRMKLVGRKEEGNTMLNVSLGSDNIYMLYVYTWEDDPAAKIVSVPRQLPAQTSSRQSFAWAKSQIKKCEEGHTCSRSLMPVDNKSLQSARPARLIDTLAFGKGSRDVRLMNVCEAIEYVTLSHCWGGNLHDKDTTTTETIKMRLAYIHYSSLSRTFKDAIRITRGLGYRYLWIDAFCIIQDAEDDWRTESAKMAMIYSKAVVNISADSSPNSRGGCFNRRSQTAVDQFTHHVVVSSTLSSGFQSLLGFYSPIKQKGVVEVQKVKDIEEGPLAKRGWVCQERILSPRILHYTSTQLYWECREGFIMEEGFTMDYSDGSSYPEIMTLPRSLTNTFKLLEIWHRIVAADYSHRQLSRESDKLPAISGIAKIMHTHIQAPYLAGLWMAHLNIGLLWMRTGPSRRPQQYRCPSFSWASLESPVQWNTYLIKNVPPKPEFFVNGFNVELQDRNAFGRVTNGWLRLTGRYRKLSVFPEDTFMKATKLDYNRSSDFLFPPGESIYINTEGFARPNALLFDHERQEPIGHAVLDDDLPELVEAYEAVALYLSISSEEDVLDVILLKPTQGSKEMMRIGVGGINEVDWFDDCIPEEVVLV